MKKGKKVEPSDRIEQIKKAAARAQQVLASDPNVISVGYGIKRTKGRPLRKWSIVVGVREKLKSAKEINARGSKRIPKMIEGFPTDVVVALSKPVSDISGPRGNVFDELAGGIAVGYPTGTYGLSYGTLGMIVFDKNSGDPMILTNWHVIHEDRSIGDPVHQPAWDDSKVVHSFEIESCPDRIMKVTDSPTNLSDIFGPLAAGAAAAAAASDEIDPIRFSQKATPPNADEQTVGEKIKLKFRYPKPPLPGIPYSAEAEWDYSRQTTGKTYGYSHKWRKKNQHVLREFVLKTDKEAYKQRETVVITAALAPPKGKTCGSYYVVAYILAPSQNDIFPVVLQWTNQGASAGMSSVLDTPKGTKAVVMSNCVDFEGKAGKAYDSSFRHEGLIWIPDPDDVLRVVLWANADYPGLNWRSGVTIELPAISKSVIARVATFTSEPVRMTAYYEGQEVGTAEMDDFENENWQDLKISAKQIDQVRIEGGGGEGVLLWLCYNPIQAKDKRCIYRGCWHIHAHLPKGLYKVYGLVQSINNADAEDEPAKAATIIGGIMANMNPQAKSPEDPCDWVLKEDASFIVE